MTYQPQPEWGAGWRPGVPQQQFPPNPGFGMQPIAPPPDKRSGTAVAASVLAFLAGLGIAANVGNRLYVELSEPAADFMQSNGIAVVEFAAFVLGGILLGARKVVPGRVAVMTAVLLNLGCAALYEVDLVPRYYVEIERYSLDPLDGPWFAVMFGGFLLGVLAAVLSFFPSSARAKPPRSVPQAPGMHMPPPQAYPPPPQQNWGQPPFSG